MDTFRSLYEHMSWADRRLLEGMAKAKELNSKTLQLMAHLVQSELVWLMRLQGNDSNHIALWPEQELTLERCRLTAESNAAAYQALLAMLTEEKLDRLIAYRNQTGTAYETSIRDILTHVAMHGQYHRGQINALLRAGGDDPVNVDMIAFVREKAAESRRSGR